MNELSLRVVLSTRGKFHTFDLARQLDKRNWLECLFTGYPMFKLKNEGIPSSRIRSFPWMEVPYLIRGRVGLKSERIGQALAYASGRTMEGYIAARMPRCDVYMGMSGTSLKGGRKAQRQDAVYICDRGSSHLRYQEAILKEEHHRQGIHFLDFDPRGVRIEEAEYSTADLITVPSTFAKRSFLEMGIPESKVRVIPYGVDLTRFHPTGSPDDRYFDVIFVGNASLQKGVPYLLESFSQVRHPQKRLTIVGSVSPAVAPIIQRAAVDQPITCTGPIPQLRLKEIMSRSHVMVHPSLQEGLALVQAQAMACGCPVIGTTNSGAQDLFQDGVEGFIVPIRDTDALTDRMQQIADSPELRQRLSLAALARVQSLGGWDRYGQEIATLFLELTGTEPG